MNNVKEVIKRYANGVCVVVPTEMTREQFQLLQKGDCSARGCFGCPYLVSKGGFNQCTKEVFMEEGGTLIDSTDVVEETTCENESTKEEQSNLTSAQMIEAIIPTQFNITDLVKGKVYYSLNSCRLYRISDEGWLQVRIPKKEWANAPLQPHYKYTFILEKSRTACLDLFLALKKGKVFITLPIGIEYALEDIGKRCLVLRDPKGAHYIYSLTDKLFGCSIRVEPKEGQIEK